MPSKSPQLTYRSLNVVRKLYHNFYECLSPTLRSCQDSIMATMQSLIWNAIKAAYDGYVPINLEIIDTILKLTDAQRIQWTYQIPDLPLPDEATFTLIDKSSARGGTKCVYQLHSVKPEHIYNYDETGLFYACLPSYLFLHVTTEIETEF